jgi:hypothetical protein
MTDTWELVLADIAKRREMGVKKYGKFTSPHDGEDYLKHLYEELLDAVVYIRNAMEERKDDDRLFNLLRKADMQAISRWQAANPGKELTWPDHADLVVWLLEQLEKKNADAKSGPDSPA